ncbi:replication initiation protein [Leuconostoc mesenteroides subsp. dextranicum]|jgi:septal ring factor EnvC (AmiA/AmiB activator)|uniref:replication initiation protein n=2 Tax=Leuconostoc mesenteroides TaxID=1245 RepID=UPI000681D11F|nr:replication initiation protein [Leuconostoc mesenteroides]MBR0430876.1 replication initiation protein [Candidatus Saccharibacteria bacterium]KMY80970.1 replication initiation protein [Leuconostoc mesenteroides subsp. dextranicum]MBZ1503562.1 replication initiation protein [Leuconostoc mesenteroides]MCT3038244.1 replication initiation protein [Leuconostoc mesenteroides]RDF90102.1 replication initiation protein [Leuconostoc mesenteroides subsp. mesenteroides]
MTEHEFNSISELAEHLKISRTTLYKRANLSDIDLTGVYSNEQLDLLSSVHPTVQQLNSSTEQTGRLSEQTEQQIKFLNKEISAKDKQIKLLSGQLKEKDLQIGLLNKHLDQAQQLQLIAEQRLTETKDNLIEYQEKENHTKKGFWSRLFK